MGDLTNAVVELRRILGDQNQDVLGWLWGSTRNQVNYKDAEQRAVRQARLDHAVGCLSILFQFAVLEESFRQSDWPKAWTEDQIRRIRAWRHVRHCAAHGFDGSRAMNSKKDTVAFEVEIKSAGLRGVELIDAETKIRCDPLAGMNFNGELCQLLDLAMVKLDNQNL